MNAPLSTELTLLCWAIALFLVHMMIQGATALAEQGFAFNAGPRDEPRPLGRIAGRARRTFENYKETFPVFAALALALAVKGRGGGTADTGAWIWLVGRVVYIPLYLAGVPWARTLVWGAALFGLILMFARLV